MKVLTIGGATQDIFLLYDNVRVIVHNGCPYVALAEGCKVELDKVLYSTGGGATNSAASFINLGYDAHILCKLGRDTTADFIMQYLAQRGINTQLVITTPDEQTGISFIIPPPSKNRAILTLRGANARITSHDIPFDQLPNFDFLYITSMTGTSSNTLCEITKYAHDHNVFVVHNPGSSQLAAGAENLKESLPFINTLILNSDEAAILYQSLAPSCTFDIAAFCKSVMALGPSIVVVTDGVNGVYVAHNDTLLFHPTLDVEVVNTIGAGDAFGSAFAAHIAMNKPIEQALISGIINAVSVISYMDTTTGLLSLDDIEQRYKRVGLGKLKTLKL